MERATTPTMDTPPRVTPERRRELYFLMNEFHCDYARTLDSGDVESWPRFFTEDALYRVVARDNLEAGLPLSLMMCDGMGMLKDRAYAIVHTEMYAPRYVQHHISMMQVLGEDEAGISAQASYLVYETLVDEPTRLLQVGRYQDVFVDTGDGLLLKARDCIYDSVMIPNCVVYPV